MSTRRLSLAFLCSLFVAGSITGAAWGAQPVAPADTASPTPPDPGLAGVWTLSLDRNGATCRVFLRPQRADTGDYFLGLPAACRHAMPGLVSLGRWASPDARHISLDDPGGKTVLAMVANADGGFAAKAPEGTYVMTPIAGTGRSAAGFDPVDIAPAPGFDPAPPPVRKRKKVDAARDVPRERVSDLAGRYAVMREKRDTGCMVTLDDTARVKGGERAQLAPGCRDQGIVIFDPSAWQVVKGKLVLTARAGHTAVLDKKDEGLWEKDVKDGGKPLGLKKL